MIKKVICVVIDVAIHRDRNVMKREAEKILKYKDLVIEIRCMWSVKAKVLPVITGAIGTISESVRQYLSNISGKREIKELQKTAILGTVHKLRGSADLKVQNIFCWRNNITCSTDCKYRTAATLYTVETWGVSGI